MRLPDSRFPRPVTSRPALLWTLLLLALAGLLLAACGNAPPSKTISDVPVSTLPVAKAQPQAHFQSGAVPEDPPGDTVASSASAGQGTRSDAAGGSTSQEVVATSGDKLAMASAPAQPTPTPTPDLPPLSRTVNVLVLGSDRRPRMPNWRTDVIMIVAMDMEKGEAAVISIPRDVYVEIPGHQANRINVVDYLGEQDEPGGGGPKLLAGIIQKQMGIPIHYYLRFEFDSFREAIDALGGVELPLDCPVYEYLPEEDLYLNLPPGTHRLTGYQALVYVRSRRLGGDLERARRQQRVVWAVRRQILAENLLPKIPALYAALKDSVQTDIGLVTAIRFARFALDLEEDDVHGMVLAPPDLLKEGWRRGMFVFLADWPAIQERVQTVFDRPPLAETNTVGEGGDRQQCP